MLPDILGALEKFFNSSWQAGFLASFLAGIVVSFSPCILPLVPITLSIVGATSVSSKVKGFFISLVFVLGIATTYTTLGVVAAWLNVLFEKFFVNPYTYLFLGLFFILMALASFGVFKINLFNFTHSYSPRRTLLSVYMLGIIAGLGITPCNFPVLGSILTLISLKKDVLYGATALFIFSLGYGILIIILGTFTSLIVKLPKRSKWIIIINRLLGIVMVLIGVYFLKNYFSGLF